MGASEAIMERIQKRTLKWFGHVLRMPEDDDLKKYTNGGHQVEETIME